MAPRTVCGCQPVASTIWPMVAPSSRIMANRSARPRSSARVKECRGSRMHLGFQTFELCGYVSGIVGHLKQLGV
jgi:hypothetical protein